MKTDLADRLSVVSITLSGWQSGVLLIQAEGGEQWKWKSKAGPFAGAFEPALISLNPWVKVLKTWLHLQFVGVIEID